jgi:uncharacterized protein (UPF0335 family)
MSKVLTNGLDATKVQSFVSRIEYLQGNIRTQKAENAARCKVIQDEIKLVLDDAKDDGIPKGPLKALIKVRDLEARVEMARSCLEPDDAEIYDQLAHAMGPLGEAAREGYVRKPPTEEELSKIGRGKDAADSLAS